MLKFAGAYYHRPSLVTLVRDMVSGFRVKMRPETMIHGFGVLLPSWTVLDRLGEIEIPALVLAGRHDFQFPPEHQAIITDRLPNAQLELIELAGHNAPQQRPDDVIQLVRRFLLAV
jgi:proline iminopeptidase